MADRPAPSGTTSAPVKKRRWAWLRWGASTLAFLFVVEYLVVPQLAGARHALELLSGIRPPWIVAAVILEGLSLASYSAFTRSMLPAEDRPGYWWLLRADLTSLGVSHVVPGGAATGNALRIDLLHDGGVPTETAVVAGSLQNVGSFLVLNALLGIGLVVSLPFTRPTTVEVLACLWVLVLLGATVLIVRSTRDPARTPAIAHRIATVAPRRWRAWVEKAVRDGLDQTLALLGNRPALRRSAVWATGNWVFDAAALGVMLAAFGDWANPAELLAGYGVASVLGMLPVSPGGLGIEEAVLIPFLVGVGATRGVATLGVLSWRLLEFWLPIPVAVLAYGSLQGQRLTARHAFRASAQDLRARATQTRARVRDGGEQAHPGLPPSGPPNGPRADGGRSAPGDRSSAASGQEPPLPGDRPTGSIGSTERPTGRSRRDGPPDEAG